LNINGHSLVPVIEYSDGFGYAHGSIGTVELTQAQLGQNMAHGKPLIYEAHTLKGTGNCGMKSHAVDNDSNLLAVLQAYD
jgi:hypothetical protein